MNTQTIYKIIKARQKNSDIAEPIYATPFEQAVNRWLRAAEDVSRYKKPVESYHEVLEPWLTTMFGPLALTTEGVLIGSQGYQILENYFFDLLNKNNYKEISL